jgi:hypothetical protein
MAAQQPKTGVMHRYGVNPGVMHRYGVNPGFANLIPDDENYLAKKLVECRVLGLTFCYIEVNISDQSVGFYTKDLCPPKDSMFSWAAPKANGKSSLVRLKHVSTHKWDGCCPTGVFSIEDLRDEMQQDCYKEIYTLTCEVRSKTEEITRKDIEIAELRLQLAGTETLATK